MCQHAFLLVFLFTRKATSHAARVRARGRMRSSVVSSVVVAASTDVGVPDWRSVRRARFCKGAIEPVLQDRFDRAVGGRADVVAALSCCLDALGPIALHEAQDAETCSEALLGGRRCPPYCLAQRGCWGADLPGLAQHPCRRPFGITAMARRHILRNGRVLVRDARADV